MISLSIPIACHPPPPLRTYHPSRQTPIRQHSPPLKRRLINHLNAGHLHEAISTLDLIVQRGTHPELITYSLLINSCTKSRNFQLGRLVHAKLVQSGLELDSVMCNSLINFYSKCGDWVSAKRVFECMGKKRDLVSWSAMILCLADNGKQFEAILGFVDMLEDGFVPNGYCFAAVIRACSNKEYLGIGEIIFGSVIKSGYFGFDVRVGCALIDMFVKGDGDLESAGKVFEQMPEKNAVAWTLTITRVLQMGYPRDAINLFIDMLMNGYKPDRFTLSGIVSASSELGITLLGQQLHSWAIRTGLSLDVCVGCSLVDMYAKCGGDGSMKNSRKVFDRIPDHNVMTWTAIITGYVQSCGQNKEAIELFCVMVRGDIFPNHLTFSSVLKACASLSDLCIGKQVYSLAVKLGFALVDCVGNSVISMYARCGRMEDAQKVLDILFEKKMMSYNILVNSYSENLNPKGTFDPIHEFGDPKTGTRNFTFVSLLNGAASIGAIGKGEQLHSLLIKSGRVSNKYICNSLISMYARSGNIEAAYEVFSEMSGRDVISWTTIINGFAKHGFAIRALETFHKMLEDGIEPNMITYVAVLTACSHVGLVSEGWKHFNSMHEHGIVPRIEHYACMVDLLGRSGFLVEALEFINSMPFLANALIWRTFLGACRVHNNRDLGRHAAMKILELEPEDAAGYVLLSNLYASSGQWDDVANIRKDMKQNNLVKEAGYSWIEVGNQVHKFYVGDTSHPLARQIYDELDQLALKIKELGYIPNTDFVLHDVEDEQKEQFLFQHSEKLAVAYGLIGVSKPKTIRVFKNLRICGDCHSAIKYISMATGREIVIRDSNRFHHIKNGKCSCNDYW